MIFKQLHLTHRWDPNTLSQSRPESNDNEGVLHTSHISITQALPSDEVLSYSAHPIKGGGLPSAGDMVNVFQALSIGLLN